MPDHDDTDVVTCLGDLYSAQVGEFYPTIAMAAPPYSKAVANGTEAAGGDLLWRWTHTVDERSNYWLQAYYDSTNRADTLANQAVNIFDVKFQHCFAPAERHFLTYGVSYRAVIDDVKPVDPFVIGLDPASRTTNLYGVFVQDEIALVGDDLKLFVGSKFEHNDFSGFEYQPGVRLLWVVDPKHVAWAAVSCAVRTPRAPRRTSTFTPSSRQGRSSTRLSVTILLRPKI